MFRLISQQMGRQHYSPRSRLAVDRTSAKSQRFFIKTKPEAARVRGQAPSKGAIVKDKYFPPKSALLRSIERTHQSRESSSRVILDLKQRNKSILGQRSKMITVAQLRGMLTLRYWTCSNNLKDVYWHVPTSPKFQLSHEQYRFRSAHRPEHRSKGFFT